ncbi:hypothetical protein B0H14DRAFT_2554252 [Mycena olivaceomarginata]|nr:hypothetical protein B0H14DRAFT_2554252 [Mycena olivaceomarginata]
MPDSFSGSTPPALPLLLDSPRGIEECSLLASISVSPLDSNSEALESTLASGDDSTSPEMPSLESIPSTPILLQDSGSNYLIHSMEDFGSDSESKTMGGFSPLLVSLPPLDLPMNAGALWSEEDDIFLPTDPAPQNLLWMKHSDRITLFLLEFNAFTSVLKWNNSVLFHALYSALPRHHITREMDFNTFPSTFEGVRAVVCQIDNQFWQQPGQRESENISSPEASGSTNDASELISEVAGAPKVGTSKSPEVVHGYSQGVSNPGGNSLDLSPPSILPTPSSVMSVLAPPPSSVLVVLGSI